MKIRINDMQFDLRRDGIGIALILQDIISKNYVEVYLAKEEALTLATALKELANKK